MKQQRFIYLINQYIGKTISAEEIVELQVLLNEMQPSELPQTLSDAWLTESISLPRQPIDVGEADRQADVILALDKDFESSKATNDPYNVQPGISGTADHVSPAHRVHFLRRGWLRYAAAIILLFGAGTYIYLEHLSPSNGSSSKGISSASANGGDIAPGRDGAILTLADGTQIVLDSLGSGIIAHQNGTQVALKNGLLVYDANAKTTGGISYNTMTTPKGRQFQLVLPDGSKVWLNAATFIRYPTVFTGKERKVEIDGEAYFEVVKNAGMPFKVKVNETTEVEVLGTHFNVNAYENEGVIKTTLLEGIVRVKAYKQLQTLVPGQQAEVLYGNDREGVSVHTADINRVMAWKNGLFNFEGANLQEVMRQLERWYDIEVVYSGDIPNIRFGGKISKNENLSIVLEGLKGAGVDFKLEEGRKLIVTP